MVDARDEQPDLRGSASDKEREFAELLDRYRGMPVSLLANVEETYDPASYTPLAREVIEQVLKERADEITSFKVPEPPRSPARPRADRGLSYWLTALIATAVSIVVCRFVWMTMPDLNALLLPSIVFGLIFIKLARPPAMRMVPALAVLGGLWTTLSLGVIYYHNAAAALLVITLILWVLLTFGVVWLLLRPGIRPVVFLTAQQIVSMAWQIIRLVKTHSIGSSLVLDPNERGALAAGTFWRALAILLMFLGLRWVSRIAAPSVKEPEAQIIEPGDSADVSPQQTDIGDQP